MNNANIYNLTAEDCLQQASGQTILSVLSRFLQRLNIEITSMELADFQTDYRNPSSIVSLLGSYGKTARIVRTSAHSFKKINAPALMKLKSGEWGIYQGHRGAKALVEMSSCRLMALDLTQFEKHSAGVTIEIMPMLPESKTFINRLMGLVWKQRHWLISMILLTLPVQLLDMAMPAATWLVMDKVIPASDEQLLMIICFAIFLLSLHRAWFGGLRDAITRSLDSKLTSGTSNGVFSHTLNLPFQRLHSLGIGELSQTLSAASSVATMPSQLLVRPLFELCFGTLSLIFVVWIQPVLALSLVLIALFILLGSILIGRTYSTIHAKEMKAGEKQESFMVELINGSSTISAAGAVKTKVKSWLSLLLREQALALKKVRLALNQDILSELAQQLSFISLLVWGGLACLEDKLSVGSMIAILMLGQNFIAYTLSLGQALFELFGISASIARVDELLAYETEAPLSRFRMNKVKGEPAVNFENVSFRYNDDDSWVLQDFNFRLNEGEIHHMRGTSGSGKTTILRLAAGLYEAQKGKVQIYGQTPFEMRKHLAYLPQNAHLFAGTIAYNLVLISKAGEQQIQFASKRTGLDKWVDSLPMGYSTVLTPGAVNLSGGQRQLIMLTAILASDRCLMLLDESLSHIDRIQRAQLMSKDLFAGKTVINITHDL